MNHVAELGHICPAPREMEQFRAWGPEPEPLSTSESPSLLGLARDVLEGQARSLQTWLRGFTCPSNRVVEAGSDPRPRASYLD